MIWAGVLTLTAGGLMMALGGPVGWVLGVVYAASGVDLLWGELRAARLRRRA